MDPFTPRCRVSARPFKVKFKPTYTPQIHPPQTPGYSSNTWATPQHQNDTLPDFSSPGMLTPRVPFNEFAAPWAPPGPAASPLRVSTAKHSDDSPSIGGKRRRRDSNAENLAPSGGEGTPLSLVAKIKELDKKIMRANAGLVKLQEERKELREAQGIRKYTPRQKIAEKLDKALNFLDDTCKWKLSDFLWHLSKLKDESGEDYHREHGHAEVMAIFLQGRCRHKPAAIIDAWFRSPDGCAANNLQLMYSTSTDFTEIKSIRAALTSFATQAVRKEIIKEAEEAIKPENGLHVSLKGKNDTKQVKWQDIGSATVAHVSALIQKNQPLLWALIMAVSGRRPRVRNGVQTERHRRPLETVCVHTILTLNFSRCQEARLLPTARGLLYFAFSAPVDLFSYNSRIAGMPAYTTIYKMLEELSKQESKLVQEHGRNPDLCSKTVIDNVQNYLRARDQRIGRENKLNVGIAATYIELPGVRPEALDLDDKQRQIAENKRQDVTVDQLLGFIDETHLDTFGPHVSLLYRTRGAKLPLPAEATKVHPLASSSIKETVTTELKAGLLDFLGQAGQQQGDYLRRLVLVGGDGLTYEKVLQLKQYMQFHNDAFESHEILEPGLPESFHSEWTGMSTAYEAHWSDMLSDDPGTMGHSAHKINRPGPSNLKKVDYYPAADLAFTILDMCMLDCWRIAFNADDIFEHFKKLAADGQLPEFEELEVIARKLYDAYSTTKAIHRAMKTQHDSSSKWDSFVPVGSAWTPPKSNKTNKAGSKGSNKKKQPCKTPPEPGIGDWTLARTIAFIRDFLWQREWAYATAEGDVGHVYEVMKLFLFVYAGSSHTNYTSYFLEGIIRLELESSRDPSANPDVAAQTGQTPIDAHRAIEAIGRCKALQTAATLYRSLQALYRAPQTPINSA
ncbi:hypothetical protein HWV62_13994 [Athelia sp. TMB]|nr:hypothetical protein HWV62_13994 [Athelia sp. TMB]